MSERLLITLAVMSATLIQVLDTTIVNVALPHMAGELGATTDQISWVLTSYLVSSAIVMPLTGFLGDLFGRKRYFVGSIIVFTASSFFCPAAPISARCRSYSGMRRSARRRFTRTRASNG